MMRSQTLLCAILCLTLGLSACEKEAQAPNTNDHKAEPPTQDPDQASNPKADPPKSEEVTAFKLERDPEVMAALNAVVEHCNEIRDGRASGCSNREFDAYQRLLSSKRFDAINTLTSVFVDKDAGSGRRQLAAQGLNRLPWGLDLLDVRSVDASAYGAVFDALSKTIQLELSQGTGLMSLKTVETAVHAGNLAKKYDEVRALINGFDASASHTLAFRAEALKAAMSYGRLEMFELVKAHVLSPIPKLQEGAFISARLMLHWSDDEDAAICAWAEGYISGDDRGWMSTAGPAWVLLKCKDRDKYAGLLIKEARSRVARKTFDNPFAEAFGELCSRGIFGSSEPKTSAAQCAQIKALLLTIIEDEQLTAQARRLALIALANMALDADGLKLMQRYATHKDSEIAAEAKRKVEALERRIKAKSADD